MSSDSLISNLTQIKRSVAVLSEGLVSAPTQLCKVHVLIMNNKHCELQTVASSVVTEDCCVMLWKTPASILCLLLPAAICHWLYLCHVPRNMLEVICRSLPLSQKKPPLSKATFIKHCGLSQFKVLSFGLSKEAATFHRMMSAVYRTSVLYPNDIITATPRPSLWGPCLTCKSVFPLIKTNTPFNWDCKFQTALDIRRRCSAGVFPSFQPYIPNALVPICVPMGNFSSHLKTRCGQAHCWHTAFPEAEENASTIYPKNTGLKPMAQCV